MGNRNSPDFAVDYHPQKESGGVPPEIQKYLLGQPEVSGFRPEGAPSEKCILVMVETHQAAAALPRTFKEYQFQIVVTGKIRAY